MRTRRLQHISDGLCVKFCEGSLVEHYPQFSEQGSGTLRFNLLDDEKSIHGSSAVSSAVATELMHWLREELSSNSIVLTDVLHAQLIVELSFSNTPPPADNIADSTVSESKGVVESIHRCIVRCKSEIETDENVYRGVLYDCKEWPVRWSLAS